MLAAAAGFLCGCSTSKFRIETPNYGGWLTKQENGRAFLKQ